MNVTEPQEPIETAVPPERFPRLWGVVVFRLAIIACCFYLVQKMFDKVRGPIASIGEMEFVQGVFALALLSIFSLIAALGLIFRQRWAGWLVVLFDFVYVSYRTGYIAVDTLKYSGLYTRVLMFLILVVFIWEGLYVATRLWRPVRAKVWYYTAAVIFLVVGVASDRITYHRQLDRVRPAFNYVDSHLWNLPVDLEKWRLKHEMTSRGWYSSNLDYSYASPRKGWSVWHSFSLTSYDNLGSGKEISKDQKGLYVHIAAENLARVDTQDDVLKVLRRKGVKVSDLRYVRSENPWKGMKVPKDYPPPPDTRWAFESKSTGIKYDISGTLEPESSVVIQNINISIPEKEYERLKKNGWK